MQLPDTYVLRCVEAPDGTRLVRNAAGMPGTGVLQIHPGYVLACVAWCVRNLTSVCAFNYFCINTGSAKPAVMRKHVCRYCTCCFRFRVIAIGSLGSDDGAPVSRQVCAY